MSAQKLVSEAEKLLERGKYPEAIEKLKEAIKADPLNQLIATKLANTYLETEDQVNAKKVLVGAAHRLSEAGKSQVAIAIYKQALEIAPNDIELRTKYALECESVGKVGDAVSSAQAVLKHYLQRKKYFDAANILPMIVRNQSKDERMKLIWVEVMQLSQADQKLVHLLVALAGPPGLVSQEFQMGGEPTAMSENLYVAFKSLVDWFPSDAKIAYAVAWCAQKRGNEKEFFHYLRECLRREPDFCLGLLLLARVLAEKQKLTEALFVYKYLRERMGSDRTVDMLTLTRLVEGFVEKNGWISFTEGMMSDGDYSQKSFLKAFLPQDQAEALDASSKAADEKNAEANPQNPSQANLPNSPKYNASLDDRDLPPKEIEINLSSSNESANGGMEIQFSSGEKIVKNPFEDLIAKEESPDETKMMPATPADQKEIVPSVPIAAAALAPETLAEKPAEKPKAEVAVELPAGATVAASPPPVEAAEPPAQAPIAQEEKEAVPGKSLGYNPLLNADYLPHTSEFSVVTSELEGSKTQLFSPMEAIQAASKQSNYEVEPKTKIIEELVEANDPTMVIAAPAASAPATASVEEPPPSEPVLEPEPIKEEGTEQATVIYDPVQVVQAGLDSRSAGKALDKQATVVEEQVASGEQEKEKNDPQVFSAVFVPIPQAQAKAPEKSENVSIENQEDVDLGEDLLNQPTKILSNLSDATSHLLKEVSEDDRVDNSTLNPSILFKKAERYIAKRNYYLARKAVRHAQALGADEQIVKEKLREIRKLEMPDSLYATVSTDLAKDEGSKNLLEKLEEEFDLKINDSDEEISQLKKTIKLKFEDILKESDVQTIMDFGVGLHEMGLYKEAENFFIRMVNDHPEQSFDAYYLAAISKFARKDYAGAVSILKKLSLSTGKSDKEKISIYYTLGEVFEKMQQSDRSKSFYEKVAALDANYRNIRDKLEK